MAIRVNNQSIQKIMLGSIPVKRIYEDMQIVFDTGGTPQPCFEVVSTISQASGDYVDVYVKSESKWYKRNNLNQYEEYGLMPTVDSLSSVTYYTGKMVILNSDMHEYKWNGNTWIDLGSAGIFYEYIFMDPPTSSSYRYNFPIKYYFGTGYHMRILMYVTGTYGGDVGGFLQIQNKAPIEFNLYANGFYFDAHNPTSTTSPDVYSGDYSTRVMASGAFNSYKDIKMIVDIEFNKVVVTDFETGTQIYSGGTSDTITGWYDGLYEPIYYPNSNNVAHVAYIQIYDGDGNLVNDLRPKYNEGETADLITWYDSVIDAEYHNTTSYAANYHKEIIGELDPPEEYDTKVPPADNVHYDTLAELEMMECPWIGMVATIGQNYDIYIYTEDGWVPGEVPLDLPYLRFTARATTTFTFTLNTIDYSIDGGAWRSLEPGNPTIEVGTGSYVVFRGNCTPTSSGIGTFSATGSFNASGNPMSLLFGDEFNDKVSLDGKSYAFYRLFYNNTQLYSCTDLVLPATTLSEYCYRDMFSGASALSSVNPNLLPANNLTTRCYQGMFNGTSALRTAPLLPAMNLAQYCYAQMFQSSGLSAYPELPATVMVNNCYDTMFNYVRIATIPDNYLPSTQLASRCYTAMFANNFSLTKTMTILPATTLAANCYDTMFVNARSLTVAPILPAETLVSGCYNSMFQSCTSLQKLVANFTTTPSTSYTNGWLHNHAATFYKNPNATWDQTITRGNSTVPASWTITDIPATNYLKFTTVDDNGSTYKFSKAGLEYSIDGGSWTALAADTYTPNVPKNSEIRFRGYLSPNGSEGVGRFYSTGNFNMSGNPATILYGEYYVGQTEKNVDHVFQSLFNGTDVVDAHDLVLDFSEIKSHGYAYMFQNCSSLVTAPARIQATSCSGSYGLRDMFSNCSSLVTAPEIDITTVTTGSLYYMFINCSSLVNPPSEIKITTISWDALRGAFQNCTSLTHSPVIRGNMGQSSCRNLFYGCSSLTEITYLGTASPSSANSDSWMYGVPATGTIHKDPSATWDQSVSRDIHGVPAGWTIDNYSV